MINKQINVASVQLSLLPSRQDNLDKAEKMICRACDEGANIVLLPELFERQYFCKTQIPEHLQLAETLADSVAVKRLQAVAKRCNVVLPVSFYERDGLALFNSIAIIDADGSVLGVYRKSHLPDGPGYQEKFYFSPGNTGFRVWQTKFATIGVGICWDQWFPEAARSMALMGAEILFYPSAIGTEPHMPEYDSSAHWQTAMCGHAACNLMPVVAANRVGDEQQQDALGNNVTQSFYGESFICDNTGQILTNAGNNDDTVLVQSFDLNKLAKQRTEWGLFRDRRPSLYNRINAL